VTYCSVGLQIEPEQAVRHAGLVVEYPYKGEDQEGHIGPEATTWELDHLIHSSTHTNVSIFVKFYNPMQTQSKVGRELVDFRT
jgi:hypothetical protein